MSSAPAAGSRTGASPGQRDRLGEVLLAVHQRRLPALELVRHEPAEDRGLARDLHDRPARHVEHAHAHQRVHRHQERAVDAAERLPEVDDPLAVEIHVAVAVHVHAAADGADELHQVRGGLAQPVAAADQRERRARPGPDALRRADAPVAVQVHAAAARGQRDRVLAGAEHGERALGPAAVAHHVDGHGGVAEARHGAGHRHRDEVAIVAEAVAEDRHRPAARWAWCRSADRP